MTKKLVKEMFAHEIAKILQSDESFCIGDNEYQIIIDKDIQVVNWTVLNGYKEGSEILRIGYFCKYDNCEKAYLFKYQTAWVEK